MNGREPAVHPANDHCVAATTALGCAAVDIECQGRPPIHLVWRRDVLDFSLEKAKGKGSLLDPDAVPVERGHHANGEPVC